MPNALWLLIRLRIKGLFRQLWSGLKTPKGVIILFVFIGMIGLMLLPTLISIIANRSTSPETHEQILTFGPFLLLAYLLVTLFTSVGSEGIYFSPEEVQNLFSGPFSRRELLVYKLVSMIRVSMLTALFLSLGLNAVLPNWPLGVLGLFVTVLFTTLLPVCMTIVGQIGIEHAFNRKRKILGIMIIGVLVFALSQSAKGMFDQGIDIEQIEPWLKSVSESSIGSILLAPFKVFIAIVFVFDGITPTYGWNLLTAFGINLGLVACIVGLDANYLGVVERTSKKMAEFQVKARATGGIGWASRKEYRNTLPMVPFWQGMGPLLWRQLLVTYRLAKGYVFVAMVLIGIMAIPILLDDDPNKIKQEVVFPAITFVGMGYMTIFFSTAAPVGFRPDIHRMEVFKSLPMGAAPIAMGQLVGSVLMLCLIQWVIVAVIAAFTPKWLLIWGLGMLAILPINYLALAVSNIMILLLPIKTAAGPKDFTALGQGIISMFALMSTMLVLLATITACSALTYYLTGNWIPTIICGLIVTVSFCIVASFVLVFAYRRFDVSLHTPV